MSLLMQDIRSLSVGDLLLFYQDGWVKVEIFDIGLNYMHLKVLEGPTIGSEWKEDLVAMQIPNRFHIYIPPPSKRRRMIWLTRFIRRVLVRWLRNMSTHEN